MAQVVIQSKIPLLLKPSNKAVQTANAINGSSYKSYLSAALIRVDNVNKIGRLVLDDQSIFLLNPESWNESKSAHWVQHVVPGQSDPILQWISSGPRTVTFDALVTKDIANPFKPAPTIKQTSSSIIATIAAKIFNAPVITPSDTNSQVVGKEYLLDISDHLNYYRSLLYPIFNVSQTQLMGSPPLVALHAGTTLSDSSEIVGNIIDSVSTVWVVTNVRINVTKQLPNLAPLEAMVNFELMQYTLNSFDRSNFVA